MLYLLLVVIAFQGISAAYVGMPCTTQNQCRVIPTMSVAVCRPIPAGGKACRCPYGYYGNHRDIYCLKVKLGTPCKTDKFCAYGVPNSICDPAFHVCVCPSNYGEVWTPSTDSTSCFERSSDELCATCNATEGTCYFDQALTCGCPCPFTFTGNPLETGCNLMLAYTGQTCKPDKSIICVDPNAECIHDGSLTTSFTCTCKTGFVAVLMPGSSSLFECARRISSDVDARCTTCIKNGGQCYDENGDDKMNGCVCPMGTSSPTSNPRDACTTKHFEVTCNTSSITFCVDTADSFKALVHKWENMHAEHYGDFLECHLKVVTDKLCCLTVSYDPSNENCGLITTESEYSTSYALWIILQEKSLMATTDICIYAYCNYHKKAHTATGVIDVTKKKLTASEGITLRPDVDISIQNKFREDVELVGARLGDLVRLIIDVTDNKNVYTNLRAEVCVVSNMLSLDHPNVESAVFILDACPYENSLIDNPPPIFVDDPNNSLRIITNFFHIPKLSTNVVFFQCCVKVCIKAEDCAPRDCDDVRRRRRAVAMSPSEALKINSDDVLLQSIAVRVKDTSSEPQLIDMDTPEIDQELLEELNQLENTLEDTEESFSLTSVGIISGVVFLVIVVALASIAFVAFSKHQEFEVGKVEKVIA